MGANNRISTRGSIDKPAHIKIIGNNLGGLNIPEYDYIGYTNTNTTTDTWIFKTGGSEGITVATLTIVFTDTTKSQISTVTKT